MPRDDRGRGDRRDRDRDRGEADGGDRRDSRRDDHSNRPSDRDDRQRDQRHEPHRDHHDSRNDRPRDDRRRPEDQIRSDGDRGSRHDDRDGRQERRNDDRRPAADDHRRDREPRRDAPERSPAATPAATSSSSSSSTGGRSVLSVQANKPTDAGPPAVTGMDTQGKKVHGPQAPGPQAPNRFVAAADATAEAPTSTVFRKRGTGEVFDPAEEAKKKVEDRKLTTEQQAMKRGTVQVQLEAAEHDQILRSLREEFGQAPDNSELEQHLKSMARVDDPMHGVVMPELPHERVVTRKLSRKERKALLKARIADEVRRNFTYTGPSHKNRFDIRAGYRWDGVDRSNGFERKVMDGKAQKKTGNYTFVDQS